MSFLHVGLDMVTEIQKVCRECAQMDLKDSSEVLGGRIIGSSPSKTLYTLEVCVCVCVCVCERERESAHMHGPVVHTPLLFVLQILHSMLMPALESENCEFQVGVQYVQRDLCIV